MARFLPSLALVLLLPFISTSSATGFGADEQKHIRTYYRDDTRALCYTTSIISEASQFLAINFTIEGLAISVGLDKDNLPHPNRLRHSLSTLTDLQHSIQAKSSSLLRCIYNSFSTRQRRGLLSILGIASIGDINHIARDADATQRQLKMNSDSLAQAVSAFKEFVKSGRESSQSTLRITISTAIDTYHTQSLLLAQDLDAELSRVLDAILTRRAHRDQVPPSSVLQRSTVFSVSFMPDRTITLLIRVQPFSSFSSLLIETGDCCSVFSLDSGLGARVPCNIAGNFFILPVNEPLHRVPPVGGNYCDAHIDNEVCTTIRLNITSFEDFPIKTCGNSSSTRGGVETLRAVHSSLHLHCKKSLQLSSVITRLGNELSLVRKEYSESVHSSAFPRNSFFTSPSSVHDGILPYHYYFSIVGSVLLALGGFIIVAMARFIFVLRARFTDASADSDRVKSALMRANLIEMVQGGDAVVSLDA